MEQLKKLEELVKEYSAVARAAISVADLAALDELKVKGVRLTAELARQVNRVQPEFTQLTRQKRAEITAYRYNAIVVPKTVKVEEEESPAEEVKVEKKAKAKKAKK